MGIYKYVKPRIMSLKKIDKQINESSHIILNESENEYKLPLLIKLLRTMKELLVYQGIMRSEIDELNDIITNNTIDATEYDSIFIVETNDKQPLKGFTSKIQAEAYLWARIKLNDIPSDSELKTLRLNHCVDGDIHCYEIHRDLVTGEIVYSRQINPINDNNKNNHYTTKYGLGISQIFHTSLENAIIKSKTKFKNYNKVINEIN